MGSASVAVGAVVVAFDDGLLGLGGGRPGGERRRLAAFHDHRPRLRGHRAVVHRPAGLDRPAVDVDRCAGVVGILGRGGGQGGAQREGGEEEHLGRHG